MTNQPALIAGRGPDRSTQIELGRAARQQVRRREHADWEPAVDRPSPVAVLQAQDARREADLVPIRHARMSVDPFTFYRGAAAIMAADLAAVPSTGLVTQLCGDAHVSNFGVFASPERRLLFDLNDFDETLRGPWEWDVKRLAASLVVAARTIGFDDETAPAAAAVRAYRTAMGDFAGQAALPVWYARLDVDDVMARVRAGSRSKKVRRAEADLAKARSRTGTLAAAKLTESVDGELRFVAQPPLMVPLSTALPQRQRATVRKGISSNFRQYVDTLDGGPRHVLEQYDVVDIAHKVVGVGSVGLRAFLVLLQSRTDRSPLLLQIKEAGTSVLEAHLGAAPEAAAGQRVVEGQRLMQAASDVFLGWSRSAIDDRQYYWRQFRDMKFSADLTRMSAAALRVHAEACGWTLARAHARSGPAAAIAAYLGKGSAFDDAVVAFARRYADQNEQDHGAHRQAIADGVLPVASEVG